MKGITELLRLLDEWRHLPAYQLERRVDIFFGVLLPEFFNKKFGVSNARVVPEFPLHKATIGLAKTDQSVKVDFAVFCDEQGKRKTFLVELKTDDESVNVGQLENMVKAREVRPRRLLCGVRQIALSTTSVRKYAQLVWRLIDLDCFAKNTLNDVRDIFADGVSTKLQSAFRKLVVDEKWDDVPIDLVLIAPNKPKFPEGSCKAKVLDEFSCVSFREFAEVVEGCKERFDPEFLSVFAVYLKCWARVPAGRVSPWIE